MAGGFGLVCLTSVNQNDKSLLDYTCSFLDKNGNKFVERSNLAVNLSVIVGNQNIVVNVQKKDGVSIFTFTIPSYAVQSLKISSEFTNPQDGGKTVYTAPTSSQVLASWRDVTIDNDNKLSSCFKSPTNCTLQNPETRLWWSNVVSPDEGLTFSDAKNRCSSLTYNGQPNTSIGARGWRLPTPAEFDALDENQIRFLISYFSIKHDASLWASYGGGNDTKQSQLEFASRKSVDASMTEKHSVICVLDRNDKWADITTNAAGVVSDCASTPDRCTLRDEQTKLWWSRVQSPLSGVTWSEAMSSCSGLSFNGQTGWRLPTADEQRSATLNDIRQMENEQWISDAMMSARLWSSDYSTLNVDAYFGVLATGYRWYQPVSTLSGFVCVRPDSPAQ